MLSHFVLLKDIYPIFCKLYSYGDTKHDNSDNGSTLRGSMLSKDTSSKSAWACLNDRFARLPLVPYEVGGNGDRFFKSVSHQLYKTADLREPSIFPPQLLPIRLQTYRAHSPKLRLPLVKKKPN